MLIVHLSQLYSFLTVTILDNIQFLFQSHFLRPQLKHTLHEPRFLRLKLIPELWEEKVLEEK